MAYIILIDFWAYFFFSGMFLKECCRVGDTSSPQHMITGLLPGWVNTDVSWLYFSINLPQPGGSWAPTRSSPVTWWSKPCTDSSMVILPGIRSCHTTKEMEAYCFNKKGKWKTADSLSDRSIGHISGIWDPKVIYMYKLAQTRFLIIVTFYFIPQMLYHYIISKI